MGASGEKRRKIPPNLQQLQNVLGMIDRWDVLDDSNKLFYEDAEQFRADRHKQLNCNNADTQKNDCQGVDEDIITRDDTPNEKQFYDAFILYADADIEFATRIIERMEDRRLKLCVKDRDILAGISFEHKAIIDLISKRCRRLVVVYSNEFLKSPLNEFLVTFTHAMQIEQKKRKIIPCVFNRMELPTHMSYMFLLDYKRSNNLYNFWDKLEESIKPHKERPLKASSNSATVSEVAPGIKVDPVEYSMNADAELPASEVEQKPVHPAIQRLNSQQPMKKSFSAWDIQETFNRVLTNKSKPASSSASELSSKVESSEQEMKKRKWYSKFGLSSSKTSLDGTADKLEKKKNKWYKSNRTKVTDL